MATKSKPLYLTVLKEAWRFAWHHPMLWVFGFFAVILGHTGVLEIVGALVDVSSGKAFSALAPASPVTAIVMPTIFGSRLFGMLGQGLLLVVGLLIAIMVVVAAVASSGALIHAVRRFNKGSLETFSESWHHGVRHFWALFWLNAGKKIILVAMVSLLSLPLYSLMHGGFHAGTVVAFVLLFVVGVLAALIISFMVNYASMYVILEEEHIGRALLDAWRMVRAHWLVSLEMAVLLLFFQIIIGFLMIVIFYLAYLPMVAFWYAATVTGLTAIVPVGGVVCTIIGMLLVFWLGSVFTTFTISAWTILYTHLKSTKGVHGFLKRVYHFAFHV